MADDTIYPMTTGKDPLTGNPLYKVQMPVDATPDAPLNPTPYNNASPMPKSGGGKDFSGFLKTIGDLHKAWELPRGGSEPTFQGLPKVESKSSVELLRPPAATATATPSPTKESTPSMDTSTINLPQPSTRTAGRGGVFGTGIDTNKWLQLWGGIAAGLGGPKTPGGRIGENLANFGATQEANERQASKEKLAQLYEKDRLDMEHERLNLDKGKASDEAQKREQLENAREVFGSSMEALHTNTPEWLAKESYPGGPSQGESIKGLMREASVYNPELGTLLEKEVPSGTTDYKNATEEQLIHTATFDPDPIKKKEAQTILDISQKRKIDILTATEEAKQTADYKMAEKIVKENHIPQDLVDGKKSPSMVAQSFRQPWARQIAVKLAQDIDPNYNEIEADANWDWYKQSGTQRLIRRTESIVAPGGAADEAMRFATLVDNPAGTPINSLKGKAQVIFGNSKRALLNLVQGLSSEEIQQIMGAQGGGEKFLEFTQALNDPNLSVDQYLNNVKELKYLILTRQLANTRGTPEQKKWEQIAEKSKEGRPFAKQAKGTTPIGKTKDGKPVYQWSDGTKRGAPEP